MGPSKLVNHGLYDFSFLFGFRVMGLAFVGWRGSAGFQWLGTKEDLLVWWWENWEKTWGRRFFGSSWLGEML